MQSKTDESRTVLIDDVDPGVRIITLNRPHRRNAVSFEMREALFQAVQAANADPQVRGVIVTGAGGHFSAGGDVDSIDQLTPQTVPAQLTLTHRTIRMILASSKPFVSAVQGYAGGSGFGLALACDFVVLSATGRFGLPFMGIGLVPDNGILHSLARRAGAGATRRLLLRARDIEPVEALRLGVADEVVEDDRVQAAALELAQELLKLPPQTWARTKQLLQLRHEDLDRSLQAEIDGQAESVASEEFQAVFHQLMAARAGGAKDQRA